MKSNVWEMINNYAWVPAVSAKMIPQAASDLSQAELGINYNPIITSIVWTEGRSNSQPFCQCSILALTAGRVEIDGRFLFGS